MESKNFKNKELICKCGCGLNNAKFELLELLEEIRTILGNKKIFIHSCSRCKNHNKEVGGVINSQHLLGKAADFHVENLSHKLVYEILIDKKLNNNLKNLGAIFIYDWGLHIDIRKNKNNSFIFKSYEKN